MNDEELAIYKRHLLNYSSYARQLKRYNEILEELEHQRLNVHSINYDKVAVQGSSDPLTKQLNLLGLIDKIESYKLLQKDAEDNIREIDEDLNSLDPDIAKVIKDIYCLKKTTSYREAKRRYVSETTMKRMMNDELKKLNKHVKWTEST